MIDLISKYLFDTQAIEICAENNPFWYASGHLGPYYINTQNLYGSKKKADEMLNLIDKLIESNKADCEKTLLEIQLANYNSDAIYKTVIDTLCNHVLEISKSKSFDVISGGERRDWFFSIITAHILNIPHATIFKTGEVYINGKPVDDLKGREVLHIADIVTKASSHLTKWIPSIAALNGKLTLSVSIADRMQGGRENLTSQNIAHSSLVNIDTDLFKNAMEANILSQNQYNMIMDYYASPIESMRNFLIENTEFLLKSLSAEGKESERARDCLTNDYYNIHDIIDIDKILN